MTCFKCGATLEKTDIFCLRCGTPILTEDDIETRPYVDYANIKKYSDNDSHTSKAPLYDTGSRNGLSTFTGDTPNFETMRISNESQPEDGQPSGNQYRDDGYHDEHESYEHESYEQPVKRISRGAVIAITIVVCLALIGVGFYFLIQPPRSQENGTDRSISSAGDGEDAEGSSPTEDAAAAGAAAGSQAITSISILSDGRTQTEFHTMVGETVLLRSRIVPEGVVADVTWSSSDPDVLEVVSLDRSGLEAHVTGKAAGVADIVLSAGGFETHYIVFVDDLPMHVQLENAIENSGSAVWLSITWIGGQHAGSETLFERAGGGQKWTMEGVSGRSDVDPVFGKENNTLTIGFTTTTRVYYLFSDGTGYFRNPDGTNSEDFTWMFWTMVNEASG